MTKSYIEEIQPTMVRLIDTLNQNGFQTTDSGDGVLNVEAGMEGALPYPHVFMRVSVHAMVEESRRLHTFMSDIVLPDREYHVELSYAPADEIAMLSCIGVTDADLKD